MRTFSPLTEQDLKVLALSGISEETAQRAFLSRVSNEQARDLFITPVDRYLGYDMSGIAFPYVWPGEDQKLLTWSVRRDNPETKTKKGVTKTERRYMNKDQNMFYIPPGTPAEYLDDVAVTVLITEGCKKALALDQLFRDRGVPALVISLNGVWGWHTRLGDDFGPQR